MVFIINSSKVFNINDKISFNAINRNKALIEEYKIYYSQLNALYSELEMVGKDTKHYEEDITFGISVIMVDAFMRCKILEEPEK